MMAASTGLSMMTQESAVERRVRVQFEYRPISALPESVQIWSDGRLVPLPPAMQPVPSCDAARAMIAALAAAGFVPVPAGQFARWGRLAPGSWWESLSPVAGHIGRLAPTSVSEAVGDMQAA